MKLKQRPDDFCVEELSEFTPSPTGAYFVYRLHKRGLDTVHALRLIARSFNVPAASLQIGGLKDRHAQTAQLVSCSRRLIGDLTHEAFTLEFVGRSDTPIGSANLAGNRFRIIVRDLTDADMNATPSRVEQARHGVPNYFDSQRFGSVRHGQGFVAKRLIQGDLEGAVRLLLTAHSRGDRSIVRKTRDQIDNAWGKWDQLVQQLPHGQEWTIVAHLAKRPGDWAGALMKLNRHLRTLLIFAYQSYLWNETVKRLLAAAGPDACGLMAEYEIGELWFPRANHEWLVAWRDKQVPLLTSTTTIRDTSIQNAVDAALAAEGLRQAEVHIRRPYQLRFKEVWRPAVLVPRDLAWTPLGADALNRGKQAGRLEFSLPPGSYATLVVKRIFQVRERNP